MMPKFDNMKQFFPSHYFIFKMTSSYRYCRNRHHNRHRYHRHFYYCFCVILAATSGEEGLKSIMREIGLGKELGDSPQKNVVQFIGCVTSHSKKTILCSLSFLLFEIYTYFFFFLLVCSFRQRQILA